MEENAEMGVFGEKKKILKWEFLDLRFEENGNLGTPVPIPIPPPLKQFIAISMPICEK
ncbi:hypothetical protein TIFTF001_050306 [Ficus carica]|uniref:Uncharacterized protein n=1 Tax=Ficus carica TaxID=3494 RepID=A0AA87ZAL2_FICCA|nr:hypothetical protein TIFTF001_050305 [Ficus carica]GMN24211.1 hypothetical protein TIFTF001_050306 [Ficus carica]